MGYFPSPILLLQVHKETQKESLIGFEAIQVSKERAYFSHVSGPHLCIH